MAQEHRDSEETRLADELHAHQIELQMQNEELRAAELELSESRDRYQELYDGAPAGYLTLSASGIIQELNLTMANLLGLERGQLVGRSLSSFMSGSDADAFCLHLREAFESGTKKGCDLTLQARGRQIAARIDSLVFAARAGQRRECRSVLVDLSELRQAQAERRMAEVDLRESDARFRLIAEHVDCVFTVYDRDKRRVTYASPGFEALSGRPVAELCAKDLSWLAWVYPQDRARVGKVYASLLDGDPVDDVHRICRPDGEVRWIRVRVFPVTGEDGRIHRDVGVIRDVTSERALEESLRQAHKMEAVGALATGVAHDVNNVLQAILGCVRIALNEDVCPEVACRCLQSAATSARRGSALADRLLAFARRQEGELRPVAVDELVTGLSPLLERLVTEQVAVTIEAGVPDAVVRADPVQLEQILMNLAANARDAMPEGGVLAIRTAMVAPDHPVARRLAGAEPAPCVSLTVQDSGTGMDARTQARIFEPFFTSKEVGKGTGLGLSTVFAVIAELSGHIEVDSEEGKGTAFTLYFPCCEPAPRGVEAEPDAALSMATGFCGTVLLVEDEPIVRMTVRLHLEALGLQVLEAGGFDAAEEIWEAHARDIDLLMSDIMLPGKQGPQLAAAFKAQAPDLKVLFMSATPAAPVGVRAAALGRVLRKPFGREELVQALAELRLDPAPLAQAAAGPPPAHHSDGESKGAGKPARAGGRRGSKTVVVVEDEPTSRMALELLLQDDGYRVLTAASPSEARAEAAQHNGPIDVLLTDVKLPEGGGVALAGWFRSVYPDLRVIFMSGVPDPPEDGSAFIRKPIDLDALVTIIEQAPEQRA